jgi:hypothetical protein
VSQRAGVARVVVTCDAARAEAVRHAQADLERAGSVAEFAVVADEDDAADGAAESPAIHVTVTLAAI